MYRSLLALFAYIFLTVPSFAACYNWTNETSQTVVLIFSYMDSSFKPTDTQQYPLQPRQSYGRHCFALNTYAHVTLINGQYNGWSPQTIFGNNFAPDNNFVIAANASIDNLSQTQGSENNTGQDKNNEKQYIITINLDASSLETGKLYNIRVTDMICPGNPGYTAVYGGNVIPYNICSAAYGRISIKNITTNSQDITCGQIREGDTCRVP